MWIWVCVWQTFKEEQGEQNLIKIKGKAARNSLLLIVQYFLITKFKNPLRVPISLTGSKWIWLYVFTRWIFLYRAPEVPGDVGPGLAVFPAPTMLHSILLSSWSTIAAASPSDILTTSLTSSVVAPRAHPKTTTTMMTKTKMATATWRRHVPHRLLHGLIQN